jgi:hypothetical protein
MSNSSKNCLKWVSRWVTRVRALSVSSCLWNFVRSAMAWSLISTISCSFLLLCLSQFMLLICHCLTVFNSERVSVVVDGSLRKGKGDRWFNGSHDGGLDCFVESRLNPRRRKPPFVPQVDLLLIIVIVWKKTRAFSASADVLSLCPRGLRIPCQSRS